jgi:hypothetical protein
VRFGTEWVRSPFSRPTDDALADAIVDFVYHLVSGLMLSFRIPTSSGQQPLFGTSVPLI